MILNIADRIRYLRDKMGLTQTDLAKRFGISRSAVNSWEMSLSLPSVANIVEMAQLFHVNTDFLLLESGKISVDITDLTSEDRELVIRLVERFQTNRS